MRGAHGVPQELSLWPGCRSGAHLGRVHVQQRTTPLTFAVVSMAAVMAAVKIQDCPRFRKASVWEVLMALAW